MNIIPNGNINRALVQRGALIEYADVASPMSLNFEFNPSSITRTRSITVKTGGAAGTQGGYDFQDRKEVVRASQGVTVNAESFTIKILLDATDRMNAGDPVASKNGVQPELDLLRSMVEPKSQGPDGMRTLAALNKSDCKAFSRQQYASVLLFKWGVHVLPVFLTQLQFDMNEYLPNLMPYRVEATLTLQVIESNNPFYNNEIKRQVSSASMSGGANQGSSGVFENL